MAHLFTIAGSQATALKHTTMASAGLLEVLHLEQWVVQHPEVLGDGVLIVTTQFDKWGSSAGDQAAERLDVLGLDANGQLVVVELKRDGDRRVHLQAITYAALVANFSKELLGRVHAQYLSAHGQDVVTAEEGLQRLIDHVDGDWDADVLAQPRIVLIAERFPLQVITTARWLTEVSGGTLTIECHEMSLFTLPLPQSLLGGDGGNDGGSKPMLCATFSKIWPVDDMADRVLGPRMDEAQQTQRKIVEKKRRARSAQVIVDNNLIPSGAEIYLNLSTYVAASSVAAVERWLDEDPVRRDIRWQQDPGKPLLWAYDRSQPWSLSRLSKRIIALATNGQDPESIAGGDVWSYEGKNLASIAAEFLDSDQAATDDL
jgi:hypothetical protein